MGATEFTVSVQVADGRAFVAPRGDVDAYSGQNLAGHLDAAMQESSGDVVIDLSGVPFVDSSGIAVLVAAAKKLRDRGHALVVESPSTRVRRLLEITGVAKVVRVAPRR